VTITFQQHQNLNMDQVVRTIFHKTELVRAGRGKLEFRIMRLSDGYIFRRSHLLKQLVWPLFQKIFGKPLKRFIHKHEDQGSCIQAWTHQRGPILSMKA